MKSLAQRVGGYYLPMQANNSDIDFFIERVNDFSTAGQVGESERGFSDEWYEFGPTLLLFILPIAALVFRRGWLLCLCIAVVATGSSLPQKAQAGIWDKLWLNSDQQGKKAWDRQHYDEAEQLFDGPIDLGP